MNRTEIMNILPHRDPMLLVDEVYLENDVAYATYTVKGDEFFLQGHFPNYPVVPGVILCEIMAQSSCLLLVEELVGRTPFYAGIDKVRFKRQVRPGDLLQIKAQNHCDLPRLQYGLSSRSVGSCQGGDEGRH